SGAWQWGGEPEQIEATIRGGRQAFMMAWADVLGEQVNDVADYVLALGTEESAGHAGEEVFINNCSACHGADGSGNPMLGAPNLADNNWIYGGGRDAVVTSIAQGRSGVMPAFGERLDDLQVKLLVAWLLRPQ